jgi:hypothetical protein
MSLPSNSKEYTHIEVTETSHGVDFRIVEIVTGAQALREIANHAFQIQRHQHSHSYPMQMED